MNQDGYAELARAIVLCAIEDWRWLISAKAYRKQCTMQRERGNVVGFGELRLFFKSEWCDYLIDVGGAEVSGYYVLRKLENELEKAMEKDKVKIPVKKHLAPKGKRQYMCLEDGFVCNTIKEAAEHSEVSYQRIYCVLDKANQTTKGHHWVTMKKD